MHGTNYEFDKLPGLAQLDAAEGPSAAVRAPGGRAVPQGDPLVGLIRNPRSHRNKGLSPEMADRPNVMTRMPADYAALRDALAEFAAKGVDYIAVDGGDGTVRDVLTCGADIFADRWPVLIALPKGKTNALTVDLGLPNHWSLGEALDAARSGNVVRRRPLAVQQLGLADGLPGHPLQGFILGAGVFTLATQAGQDAHRYGAFNSFAVGLTIAWGILQTLFGLSGNPWRALTPMRLRAGIGGDEAELPRSGHGRPGERFLLVATTFERFPLGARPFGPDPRPGLKLGVMDFPLRRLIALIPAILAGFQSRFLRDNGAYQLEADEIEMELGGSFILDGEAFPPGRYRLAQGPLLSFVVP